MHQSDCLPFHHTFFLRPFPEVLSKAEGGSQQAAEITFLFRMVVEWLRGCYQPDVWPLEVDLVLTAGLGGIPDGVYRFEVPMHHYFN